MSLLCGRQPDFSNLAAVLEKRVPSRPTLFEFFLNGRLYDFLTADLPGAERMDPVMKTTFAYAAAGYDYVTVHPLAFGFPVAPRDQLRTRSLNSFTFTTREGFDAYRKNFRSPKEFSSEAFDRMPEYLPKGMKVIPYGPGGILENAIELVGYENLCMMIYEDEALAYDLFEFIGENLLEYYSLTVDRDFVGAAISNDDWGFNTQTMLSPKDMRRFVFPWHKKIAELFHGAGKYAILHSCGYYAEIIDDVIDDMKFDARHSYEDNICPVEKAYEDYAGRIAVLGGIDVNWLIQSSPEEVSRRAEALLEQTASRGGFALGSGNSIPDYVPDDHYFAMIRPALV